MILIIIFLQFQHKSKKYTIPFTCTKTVAPVIIYMTPNSGTVGDTVVVAGWGFGTDKQELQVDYYIHIISEANSFKYMSVLTLWENIL